MRDEATERKSLCRSVTKSHSLMKIIVRGTNWIGDAVMTIPALRQLRRVFPDARITLHTRSWANEIFQDADFIDGILTIGLDENVFEQAKKLRPQKFDLAVLLTNSFQTALVVKLGKVKRRFGYANEGRSVLLTDSVKIPEWKTRRHESFYYLNLIAEIERKFFMSETVLQSKPQLDLKVSDKRRAGARRILEAGGVDLSKKIVALGVGSTNSRAKRWQAAGFAELNDRLQEELKADVVLIGAKDELEVSQDVFEKSKIKPKILTGKTSLSEAVAILSEINLLVSNDMGLAHVAPAVGTKTLVIFGPTNPQTTQPIGAEIIRRETVECSPCMLRDCPIDHRCMTRISAKEVFDKAFMMIYDTMPS